MCSLKARKDTLPPRTFISALLGVEDPVTGGPLSDDRLKAEVAILVFAGWVTQ